MFRTCDYVWNMSKMIQLRNVPEKLHRRLKARAAYAGLSLSDYLLNEIRRVAEYPTLNEMKDLLAGRESVELDEVAAEAVRRERDAN